MSKFTATNCRALRWLHFQVIMALSMQYFDCKVKYTKHIAYIWRIQYTESYWKLKPFIIC